MVTRAGLRRTQPRSRIMTTETTGSSGSTTGRGGASPATVG